MIEISVLGQIGVWVDGRPVTGLSAKHRQVLAILVLAGDTPVSKERLADQLWQGSPPASYVSTLDSYVCVLRRQLGLAAGRGSQLGTTEHGFRLTVGGEVSTDLARFRALADSIHSARNAEVVTRAEQALALVRGELAAEVPYADWAVRARDAFAREAVELWVHGAQRANALGDSLRAERLAQAAIDRDPVCEDAWRQLMLAHWFSGRRASALAAYGELRAALAEHIGDEPGQESQDLYLAILRDVPAVSAYSPTEQASELKTLLRLLRQALDNRPGACAPARDAALSEAAVMALAGGF